MDFVSNEEGEQMIIVDEFKFCFRKMLKNIIHTYLEVIFKYAKTQFMYSM